MAFAVPLKSKAKIDFSLLNQDSLVGSWPVKLGKMCSWGCERMKKGRRGGISGPWEEGEKLGILDSE